MLEHLKRSYLESIHLSCICTVPESTASSTSSPPMSSITPTPNQSPKYLASQLSSLLGLDLNQVSIRIGDKDERLVGGTQHAGDQLLLLRAKLSESFRGKTGSSSDLASKLNGVTVLLQDGNVRKRIQTILHGLGVRDDHADVRKGVGGLDR